MGAIALYLALSVGSCLAAHYGGPRVTPWVAFGSIGLMLSLKDYVQTVRGPKAAVLLVIGGAVLSLTCPGAWRIALSGALAMGVAGLIDVWILHRTRSYALSDLVSSIVDSIIFLSFAFGGGPYLLQSALKFLGAQAWRSASSLPEGTNVKRVGPFIYQDIPNFALRIGIDLGILQLYFHVFWNEDKGAALHNHPRQGLSLILRGGYSEETLAGFREVRWINWFSRTTFHRIARLHQSPTVTLCLFWGESEEWGFWDGSYKVWTEVLKP